MARPSSMAQRPLTLTEELEKLEQQITLTLQEIDHNFSQAHRIVTTSILPLVEQYAEHSRDVWEGAKFWKQFFEASANVSLSGYEEKPDVDTTQDQTLTEESTSDVTHSNLTETMSYETPSSERLDVNHRADDLELTSLSLSSHSTPRAATHKTAYDDTTITSSAAYTSPYETLKQEMHETEATFDMDDSNLPSTPGRPPRLHDYALDPTDTPVSSSPFVPPVSREQPSGTRRNPHQKPTDPVMHRVLDKTYRVQATPLKKGATSRSKFTITPKQSTSKYAFDDSPISSPEPEAPQLHAEIFSSPLKPVTPGTGRKRRTSNHLRTTPKPGMSVLTPAKNRGGKRPVWASDEDSDDFDDENFGGPSPPKTMQFHIPQSRLMKTPAKEASRRIVEDLLLTAGANDTTDDFLDEQSPSVIRRVERLEDETF